jgi:hypothetical protein
MLWVTLLVTDFVASRSARADDLVVEPIGASASAVEAGADAREASSQADNSEFSTSSGSLMDRLDLTYFMIFFGPSVTQPSDYQPTATGTPDPNRPVLTKNFLTLGYNVSDQVQVSASGSFTFVPTLGQEFIMKDPYLRIAHNSLISTDNFNLYGDFRVHMPVTFESRNADMLAGFQVFNIAWYQFPGSRLAAGLFTSARLNVYGGLGEGDDVELYVGPNLYYQLASNVALTLLFESGTSHKYSTPAFQFATDGTDIEPGVSWDITPKLNVAPYLTILTDGGVSLKKTSIGMTLNWAML